MTDDPIKDALPQPPPGDRIPNFRELKPKCPACGSAWTMYLARLDMLRCRTCGQIFVKDDPAQEPPEPAPTKEPQP